MAYMGKEPKNSEYMYVDNRFTLVYTWNEIQHYQSAVSSVQSLSPVLTLWNPMDCSPPGCPVHGDSPGKNTGGGCHVLLQMRNTQFSLVAQSCLTLCDLRDCSTTGFPVHHQLSELAQTYVHRVGDAIQPSHPLSFPTLPASVLPSIRVFSNESVLCIRWLKYCSFSFSISSSNEYWCMYSFGTSLLFHVRF